MAADLHYIFSLTPEKHNNIDRISSCFCLFACWGKKEITKYQGATRHMYGEKRHISGGFASALFFHVFDISDWQSEICRVFAVRTFRPNRWRSENTIKCFSSCFRVSPSAKTRHSINQPPYVCLAIKIHLKEMNKRGRYLLVLCCYWETFLPHPGPFD